MLYGHQSAFRTDGSSKFSILCARLSNLFDATIHIIRRTAQNPGSSRKPLLTCSIKYGIFRSGIPRQPCQRKIKSDRCSSTILGMSKGHQENVGWRLISAAPVGSLKPLQTCALELSFFVPGRRCVCPTSPPHTADFPPPPSSQSRQSPPAQSASAIARACLSASSLPRVCAARWRAR